MTDRDTEKRPAAAMELDAALARLGERAPDPLPDRLRARLLAAALAEMPAPSPAPSSASAAPQRGSGPWLRLWQILGGAPGLSGLTAAGLAGLWIGAAAPAPVAGLSGALWQGAALVSPDLAGWTAEAPAGFDDDPLLALLAAD